MIVLAHDDCIVTSPVDKLHITYVCQAFIEVVGSLTVCVDVPVKDCIIGLAIVRVVVPAAVAVVANQFITSHSTENIQEASRAKVVSAFHRSIDQFTNNQLALIVALEVPEIVACRFVQSQPNQVVEALLCGINDGAVADDAPD